MHIEFFPDGSQDCPAIVFYGCPSAGAEALITTFRSLAEPPEKEVALHQLPYVTTLGEIQLFASNADGHAGVRQLSDRVFRWHQDREGWLQVAELAEPVAYRDASDGIRFQYIADGRIKVIFSTHRVW